MDPLDETPPAEVIVSKDDLTRESAGVYSYIYLPTEIGTHSYEFIAGGSFNGRNEKFFSVYASKTP